jgi:hypothetical protein
VKHDFRKWAIALLDVSQGYAGELVEAESDIHHGRVVLESAFAYLGGYQVTPQGVGRMRVLVPIEMQVGLTRITTHCSTLIRFVDLEPADFRELSTMFATLVEAAEGLRDGTRTRRSGLVLAPAGAKLPPMMPTGRG